MPVTRHSDPDAFLAAAAPMAVRGQASASFFIGWAHAMKRTPPAADERIYLATARDDANFGVAIRRDDGPLIIGQSDAAAAVAFADDLAPTAGDCRVGRASGSRGVRAAGAGSPGAHRLRVPSGSTRFGGQRGAGAPAHRTATKPMPMADRGASARSWRKWAADPPNARRALLLSALRGEYRIWDHDGRVAFAGFSDAAPISPGSRLYTPCPSAVGAGTHLAGRAHVA
jgi:hypothetical protein